MGASVHLHLSSHGEDVVIIVPTSGLEANFEMGDEIRFSINGNVAHVFSKETEENLEW